MMLLIRHSFCLLNSRAARHGSDFPFRRTYAEEEPQEYHCVVEVNPESYVSASTEIEYEFIFKSISIPVGAKSIQAGKYSKFFALCM